jgi:DnaJ-class molecular chaperone
MKDDKETKKDEEPEDCPWCNSTGDTDRTRRLYWSTVLGIAVFILILYLLSLL